MNLNNEKSERLEGLMSVEETEYLKELKLSVEATQYFFMFSLFTTGIALISNYVWDNQFTLFFTLVMAFSSAVIFVIAGTVNRNFKIEKLKMVQTLQKRLGDEN